MALPAFKGTKVEIVKALLLCLSIDLVFIAFTINI